MDAKTPPKDTVADLIAYLQTLPPETKVRVACAACRNWDYFTEFKPMDLDINVSCWESHKGFVLDLGED
jgi:hypothetical protein